MFAIFKVFLASTIPLNLNKNFFWQLKTKIAWTIWLLAWISSMRFLNSNEEVSVINGVSLGEKGDLRIYQPPLNNLPFLVKLLKLEKSALTWRDKNAKDGEINNNRLKES